MKLNTSILRYFNSIISDPEKKSEFLKPKTSSALTPYYSYRAWEKYALRVTKLVCRAGADGG